MHSITDIYNEARKHKKVTALACARVSASKVKKTHLDQEDSFLRQPVSTISTSTEREPFISTLSLSRTYDMVLAMLRSRLLINSSLREKVLTATTA